MVCVVSLHFYGHWFVEQACCTSTCAGKYSQICACRGPPGSLVVIAVLESMQLAQTQQHPGSCTC